MLIGRAFVKDFAGNECCEYCIGTTVSHCSTVNRIFCTCIGFAIPTCIIRKRKINK